MWPRLASNSYVDEDNNLKLLIYLSFQLAGAKITGVSCSSIFFLNLKWQTSEVAQDLPCQLKFDH